MEDGHGKKLFSVGLKRGFGGSRNWGSFTVESRFLYLAAVKHA
jgi:hypothetical protein